MAELVSYFQAREQGFAIREATKAFFSFSIGMEPSSSTIDDLGGIIKIGKVALGIDNGIVEKAFLHEDKQARAELRTCLLSGGVSEGMLEAPSGKNVFGVSVYHAGDSFHRFSRVAQRFIGSSIKSELAARGMKSSFMGFPRERRDPQLSHVEVLKKGLVERRAEVLFCVGKRHALLSTTVAVHNPFEFQKRDVGRPVQRKIFAIPPRLARIMVNLAFCKPGKVLLDPFCGVGTILQEALLCKAIVIGMDVNPWCVKATTENLNWLKKEYGLKQAENTVIQGDSRRLTSKIHREVDCIATEPDLGPALLHVPTATYAAKIINKLKPLYDDFVEEAYRTLKKDGRLVLVTPYFKTRSGTFVPMEIEEKALSVGFKIVYPFQGLALADEGVTLENLSGMSSFIDAEERHRVGRQIHVFQK